MLVAWQLDPKIAMYFRARTVALFKSAGFRSFQHMQRAQSYNTQTAPPVEVFPAVLR